MQEQNWKNGNIIATKMITEQRLPVMHMFRDIINDEHNGWVMMSGFEDEEYLSNPDNYVSYNVYSLLVIDPSVKKYLNAPYGTGFIRHNPNDEFKMMDMDLEEYSSGCGYLSVFI